MNAKQSLKIVSKRLANVEAVLAQAQADIKDYNYCIDGMIKGESPCKWCEEEPECQLEAKGGKGCDLWWLRYRKETVQEENSGENIVTGFA